MSMFGSHVPTSVRKMDRRGTQWKFRFDNGFGASVIDDGYGREAGLFELAVLHGGDITYATPITDDVLGYLTAVDVTETLSRIAALRVVSA